MKYQVTRKPQWRTSKIFRITKFKGADNKKVGENDEQLQYLYFFW